MHATPPSKKSHVGGSIPESYSATNVPQPTVGTTLSDSEFVSATAQGPLMDHGMRENWQQQLQFFLMNNNLRRAWQEEDSDTVEQKRRENSTLLSAAIMRVLILSLSSVRWKKLHQDWLSMSHPNDQSLHSTLDVNRMLHECILQAYETWMDAQGEDRWKGLSDICSEFLVRPPSQISQSASAKVTDMLPEVNVQQALIATAWQKSYEGDHDVFLWNTINSMDRGDEYSNTVPIINSSGMGKSCMVNEMAAKHAFTVPFNLRPDQESSGTYIAYLSVI
ncbi:hypothetical protein K474DRAFT_1675992 [Panus rudis PR-1116 ss-1]|nr:hypothetical protein K474DRAFT_1675992 [Panus rudis PR-1116 ss-1]